MKKLHMTPVYVVESDKDTICAECTYPPKPEDWGFECSYCQAYLCCELCCVDHKCRTE